MRDESNPMVTPSVPVMLIKTAIGHDISNDLIPQDRNYSLKVFSS